MKHLLVCLFLLLPAAFIFSQEKHFVFIQNNNNQPFYVQLNGNVFSSTSSGYLNIAQLLQGKYYLLIGFPKNIFPEQKFVVDVKDGEAGIGFTLKQQEDKSFVLLNYITEEIVQADNPTVQKQQVAVNPAIIAPVEQTKTEETKTQVVVHPVSGVIKTYDKQSALGIDQVYVDKTIKPSDTIAIFIPAEAEKKTVNIVEPKIELPVALKSEKTSCTAIANTEDFYKLRLDMAAATTDEAMVVAANKTFEKKCFSVEQIKNLGVLFLAEKGRYSFFEAAKMHITDLQNFAGLNTQFTQEEYKQKFAVLSKGHP